MQQVIHFYRFYRRLLNKQQNYRLIAKCVHDLQIFFVFFLLTFIPLFDKKRVRKDQKKTREQFVEGNDAVQSEGWLFSIAVFTFACRE